jgi:hypothetical protein
MAGRGKGGKGLGDSGEVKKMKRVMTLERATRRVIKMKKVNHMKADVSEVNSDAYYQAFKEFFDLLTEQIVFGHDDKSDLEQWLDILEGDLPDDWKEEDLVKERACMIEERISELEEEEEDEEEEEE